MTPYPLFVYALAFEIFILTALLLTIIVHSFIFYAANRTGRFRRKVISDYFFSIFEGNPHGSYPGRKSWKKELLLEVEAYNYRISGEKWEKIKLDLTKTYLLPYARRYAHSSSWRKRNFAARAFTILSLNEDQELILSLMGDKEYIVRSPASLAAVRFGSELAIHKSLYAIAHNQGYEYYFYLDLLLSAKDKVLNYILNFAMDPDLKVACLKVLEKSTWPKQIPFLKDDLESVDPLVRSHAFAVLLKNEFPGREEFFKQGLEDTDIQVRIYAIRGLAIYPLAPHLDTLIEFLRNPIWEIRLEAAKTLTKTERGLQVLQAQTEKLAQEASQYVLNFNPV